MRLILRHLPLIAAVGITILFSSDAEIFEPLRTEENYGIFVVVLVPLAVLLFLAQIVIWVTGRTSRRSHRTD